MFNYETILQQIPIGNFNSVLLSLFPCSQIERPSEYTYYWVIRDNMSKLLIEDLDTDSTIDN